MCSSYSRWTKNNCGIPGGRKTCAGESVALHSNSVFLLEVLICVYRFRNMSSENEDHSSRRRDFYPTRIPVRPQNASTNPGIGRTNPASGRTVHHESTMPLNAGPSRTSEPRRASEPRRYSEPGRASEPQRVFEPVSHGK